MTNVGKRFTRFTNVHKMSNACASSSGRYIKSLNEWFTMYVKNFNFLFKSTFLRKNGRTEKYWNSFAVAPPEKQAPLYWTDSLQNLNNCSTPTYQFKKGEVQKMKHSIVPRVFLHILLYISTVYTRVQGFIQTILMSGRRHKKLNLLIDFSNLIFIKFCFKANKNMLKSNLHSK